jgi:uncharacterized protein DUF2877
MIAHRVAAPVLEHAGARGVVAGVVGTAAYVDFDGFVVAVTARGVPLMPNGIGIADRPGGAAPGGAISGAAASGRAASGGVADGWPPKGAAARLTVGGLRGDGWAVSWPADEPPLWDPAVPRANGAGRAAIRARGDAILRGAPPTAEAFTGVEIAREPAGRQAIAALLAAVRSGDAEGASYAADTLLGRGPGLTPEGDDLLAGAAAAVRAYAQWPTEAWLAAVAATDARQRTTALSATLLELAADGAVVEPARALLDLSADHQRAQARLERLGHSTGACYTAAIGATAALLGS